MGHPLRKRMATTAVKPELDKQAETTEQRFQRLVREARTLRPEAHGTAEEINRDANEHFDRWAKSRKRANKIA